MGQLEQTPHLKRYTLKMELKKKMELNRNS